MIQSNRHRHSLSWLCRCLGVSRHYFYYQCKTRLEKKVLKYAQEIQAIFNRSYQSYGTRRIRKVLSNQGIIVSRRYVAKVMKALSLKSKYTVKRYKNHSKEVNSVLIANHITAKFYSGHKSKCYCR
ncbi:IS3 family transposase [Gilliamella apicola]|uniref:IS3 family transposase n=1 Tax=Gilliamella apicola TaxID=1196095 RepID=UPI0015E8C922|nr:IS3 family transposase [Gilliamella apicola]